MKDKEMIEEMARDIIRSASLDVYGRAEYYYEQGYRKIPKDSVVLSRGELEKMVNAKMKCINDMAIIARKETAEIFHKLFSYIGSQQLFCIVDEDHKTLIDCDKLFEFVGNLAKQFGVEVEE